MTNIAEAQVVETLDLSELAQACHVAPEWVHLRLFAGLLTAESPASLAGVRLNSRTLVRARRMYAIERNFDANPELAALVVDLIEELDALKCRLQR